MRLTESASRGALTQAAAAQIAEALKAGIAARGTGVAALSGGSAEAAYVQLAQMPLDWPRVRFALVDERFVPPEHAASNEGMLRRVLAPALAQGAQIVSMYAARGNAEAAAAHADALYAPLHIDIALMGMGTDGHTASWFPGSAELSAALDPNSKRSILAAHAPQAAGTSERLTLTLPALARAQRLVLLISGAEKRARLEQALRDDDAPVAALFKSPLNTEVLWAA